MYIYPYIPKDIHIVYISYIYIIYITYIYVPKSSERGQNQKLEKCMNIFVLKDVL